MNPPATSADPNALRVAIAREVVARKQAEHGVHLLAAGIYGSVAHHAAAEHSDVEVVLLTDDDTPAYEEQFFIRGAMVECDVLPASRMLSAAGKVGRWWGIEADQYRHHLVLHDPLDMFPGIWLAASAPPVDLFIAALRASWWPQYESRGKLLNAVAQHDTPCVIYTAWEFAYIAAMRIALAERRPYESGRTVWQDVRARGYGMAALLDALTVGHLADVIAAAEDVWGLMESWYPPEDYGKTS